MPKTTFRAVSPITGNAFTRGSIRAYTHAVIHHFTTAHEVAKAEAERERYAHAAAVSREIAKHLRAGTTPTAGSILLGRPLSMSYAEERAGVKTEWDSVVFSLSDKSWDWEVTRTPESFAAFHEKCAAEEEERVAKLTAEIADLKANNTVREVATFHHSEALAAKAAEAASAPIKEIIEVEIAKVHTTRAKKA